jgi:Protein of unknown function DUF115
LTDHFAAPLYRGGPTSDKEEPLVIDDGHGDPNKFPIRFNVVKPTDPTTGELRDQTNDAAKHMRYAYSLNLPELKRRQFPRLGRAVIVGGAPSVRNHLKEIRQLSKDPNNCILAINWTHTWLLEQNIIPTGTVFFEIDPEPDGVILKPHKNITYFICCHCHPKTFDSLKGYKRVLWHTPPNSEPEGEVNKELFPNSELCGGGIGTFTRTLTVALFLGYRHLDIFGCDSSFPDNEGTHVRGYETIMDPEKDGMYVWAKDEGTGEVRRFKTLGYLALQLEEFKQYALTNHQHFSCRIHGDSLLRFTHSKMFPSQYATSLDDCFVPPRETSPG